MQQAEVTAIRPGTIKAVVKVILTNPGGAGAVEVTGSNVGTDS